MQSVDVLERRKEKGMFGQVGQGTLATNDANAGSKRVDKFHLAARRKRVRRSGDRGLGLGGGVRE